MNPVIRYIEQKGITRTQLARIVGVSPTQITLWAQGRRKPSVDMAFRLESATGGGIPAKAWTKVKRAA